MQKENHSVFAIAGTYVGTVVGAGFATGQEVLQFFTLFGLRGIWGSVLATLLFAVLGAAVLLIANRVAAASQRELLGEVTGSMIGTVLDWTLAIFLFLAAGIMMAGSGAVFAEHWGLSRGLGTVTMAVLATGTVLMGLRGVVTAISAVAPVLIGMVLLISIATVVRQGISPADLAFSAPREAAYPSWPVSTLLYVSYNLLFSVAVLAPLGAATADTGRLRLGGLIGGAALGLGALAINLALLSGLPEVTQYEVPMLRLAGGLPPWVTAAYAVVLWAEVYTTAVSSLFGLAVRFVPGGNPGRYRLVTVAAGVGALGVSQLGFAQMVALIFPLVGWLGLLFVVGIGLKLWRGQRVGVR